MRNRMGNVLLGGFLLVVGVGFLGNVMDLWHFDLFFDGWWTLFIIVPCVIAIVQHGMNIGSIIGLIIGVSLLLRETRILPFSLLEMIWPLGIILIGLLIIFQGFIFRGGVFKGRRRLNHVSNAGTQSYTAIFGGQETDYDGQTFSGCDILAVFGGVEIDLRKSIIDKDVEISAITIFGGAEVFLPPNIQVKTSCVPIFGGLDNKMKNQVAGDAPTVYVNATCIFGGVDIR